MIRLPESEDGLAAVQWVLMIGIAMMLLVMIANLVAIQYTGGAVRAALDEGSRLGASLGHDESDCKQRADSMLFGSSGLLRGPIGDSISVACEVNGDLMVATATGAHDWWIGVGGPFGFTMRGEALIEAAP